MRVFYDTFHVGEEKNATVSQQIPKDNWISTEDAKCYVTVKDNIVANSPQHFSGGHFM